MKLFNLFKIGINKYIRKWLTCALKIRFTKKEFFANHLNIKEFNLFQPESTDYTVDYRDIFSQQGTRNWEGGGGEALGHGTLFSIGPGVCPFCVIQCALDI